MSEVKFPIFDRSSKKLREASLYYYVSRHSPNAAILDDYQLERDYEL